MSVNSATPYRRLAEPAVWSRERWGAAVSVEADRLFLWLPVLFGTGILCYFALRFEPSPAFAWSATGLSAAFCLLCRRRPVAALAALALLALCAGFALAQARTTWIAAPRLAAPVGPAVVTGNVASVEPSGGGWRMVLNAPTIAGVARERTPHRLRLTVRGVPPGPGSHVRLRARLMPPPSPAMPGGFDFQQQSWFAGLGAVGYALGPIEVVASSGRGTLGETVASIRQAIDGRILAVLDDDRGALASALITGLRGRVSEETLAAMRDSGLAHLLAISGLHMSLVAGFVFFAVRAGLAAIPSLALRWQTRKLAAAAALLCAAAYLLLSGATVPTQRAFVMLLLALAAILADRLEVSMRPIALAAMIVLLLTPEAVLGPSFQLSFAAVVSLVAAYEALRRRREKRAAAGLPPPARWLTYPAALVFTSVIAAAATAPFAAYHFNQAATYSIAANMIAVPATGMWVMPCGIVALLAMPFGLEALPLHAMAAGIDVIRWAARETAAWPGAAVRGLVLPPAGIAAVAAGGLWLCLWQTEWRLLGPPVLAAGLATALLTAPADILLADDGDLAAVRDSDGVLLVSSLRRGSFERQTWLRHTGASEAAAWPDLASAGGAMRCDGTACLFRRNGRTVAFIRHEDAVDVDCGAADLVVILAPISSRLVARRCAGTAVLRYRDLRREGAHAIWLTTGGVVTETVSGRRGDRPWTAGPETAAQVDQ